jgi:hypothetical protein
VHSNGQTFITPLDIPICDEGSDKGDPAQICILCAGELLDQAQFCILCELYIEDQLDQSELSASFLTYSRELCLAQQRADGISHVPLTL